MFAPILAAAPIDLAVFAACALIVLAGALGVVLSRNPVYAALSLVLTLFGVAILFVEQDAQFLAAVQVIVYAGAIVVLFLFVIMLLGVDRQETLGGEPLRAQRPLALIVGLAGLGEVLALARVRTWATGAASSVAPTTGPGSNVEKLARSIFTTYLLPFELTSALLIIGAVVLARRPVRGVPPEALPTEDLDVPVGPGDGVRAVDGEPLADEEVASR